MKKFLPLLLLVGLMGCVESVSLETIFNNLPQVQAFLSEHSGAEVVFTYWSASEVNASIDNIEDQCEKPMTVQDMYFARVSEEEYELIAWFDSNYNPLCVVRKQSFSDDSLTVTNTSPEIIDHELDLVLEKDVIEGCVKLKWTPYPYSDLKYYKVVRSTTNTNPKYPEDGWIAVLTSRLDNTYLDCNYDEGVNHYGVTMITKDHGTQYTNPVKVFMEGEGWGSEQELAYEVELNYVEHEGCIKLYWTPWPEPIKYYKVVRSTTNPEPKYPDDGYISVISNREETHYLDCSLNYNYDNYYRITTVLTDSSKVHSNVLTIETEGCEECAEPVVELFGIKKDSGCVVLEWESNIDNLQYFKVVRSTTNPEPKYPEDGYIQATEGYRFEDCELNRSAVNYYRITAVLTDSSKVHSNIVVID